jgi:hypothetical protein
MRPKDRKRLQKLIGAYYWKNDQHLVLDTYELFENNDRDCSFSVHLKDGPYLFDIMNYNGLKDVYVAHRSCFATKQFDIIEQWDGVTAAMQPLYFDGIITLKKFEAITKEDIINAAKYFVREILDMWPIFNIKFMEEARDV